MRRGEPVPRAFQAPVDVHASVDGQVYLFRGGHEDSAESSEEEEFSMTELRPRSRDSGSQERERAGDLLLLERDVVHGDNLNKLALQYGCKVADIKRVNNLIQEQDLYALKSIKIPVKKHSFLTEGGGAAHPPEVEPGPSSGAPPPSTHPAQSWALTPNGSAKPRLQEYTDFLKEVDQDIEMLIQSTDAQDAIFSERQEGPQRGAGFGRPTSYGADWGIQWWNAVVVMLLVGIILPLFYIVYYKTQDSGASAASEGVASVLNSTSGGDRSNLSALTQRGSQPHVLNRPLL